MKFTTEALLFFNLCFRVFILIHVLRENLPKKVASVKPFKQWMAPLSKRVFLIVINGLGSDFLMENSTPYLQEMVENYGFSGIIPSAYFETNEGGVKTILTGRGGHASPIFWSRPRCFETFLTYLDCKCGMGIVPPYAPMTCSFPEENPLEQFLKFPNLFNLKNKDSCLYFINFNIDPVLVDEYHSKLQKIDNDIKILANTVDSVWDDNRTTYIVTSARGSPVGRSLSTNSPILAWGRGIAYSEYFWMIKRADLTAMICVLLGISFPTGLYGVIPSNVMDLSDYYRFEWALYTIKHFENILKLVNVEEQHISSSELEVEQLFTRLNSIMSSLKRKSTNRWQIIFAYLIFSHVTWNVHLLTISATGYAQICFTYKGIFALFVLLATILRFFSTEWELKVPLAVLLWLLFQNAAHVCQEMRKIGKKCLWTLLWASAAVIFVGKVGNLHAIPILFAFVILWPLINGSYSRLNILILFTRLLSGIALSTLPLNRTFGEMPNVYVNSFVSALFLIHINVLLWIFKITVDFHSKFINFLIVATSLHLHLVYGSNAFEFQHVISSILLSIFFLSVCFTSGTLLERLVKVYLLFFVPVQMLSIRIECIFYFSMILHMFTWVFVEYHEVNPSSLLKFSPEIFTVEPGRFIRSTSFSIRKIFFFLIYVYLSYFAIGHFPELHSYDFYVLPNFFYRYPHVLSYLLTSIKFFISFFIPTITFIVLSNLLEKDCEFQIVTFVCASDAIGFIMLFFIGFLNRIFLTDVFPGKFTYYVLQQISNICIIFSYFLGSHLLFTSDSFFSFLPRKQINQKPIEPGI